MTISSPNPSAVNLPLVDFCADAFQPLLEQKIRFLRPAHPVTGTREPVDLELIEIERFGASPAGKRQPFSLLFRMEGGLALNDSLLHELDLHGFEPCDLLVSRVSIPRLKQGLGIAYYEAVFS